MIKQQQSQQIQQRCDPTIQWTVCVRGDRQRQGDGGGRGGREKEREGEGEKLDRSSGEVLKKEIFSFNSVSDQSGVRMCCEDEPEQDEGGREGGRRERERERVLERKDGKMVTHSSRG